MPGILWGLLVMFLAGVKAKKCGYVAERRIPAKDAMKIILDAIPKPVADCDYIGRNHVWCFHSNRSECSCVCICSFSYYKKVN